jgi:membrane fusion protein (multidrug efflux system)
MINRGHRNNMQRSVNRTYMNSGTVKQHSFSTSFERRMSPVVYFGALLSTAFLMSACGGSKAETASEEEAKIVLGSQDAVVAQQSDVIEGIVLTGSLDPAQVVNVKAQIAGTVRGVRVNRGTAVQRGQVLATIEALGVQSQAASAQAGVAAREAGLALAKQQLDAATTLHKAGAMSAIDLRAAQAAYEAAQAELAAAKAAAAGASESAARSTVVSPITGVISERRVEGGEAVMPDAPLFTVVNSDTLELAGQIPVARASGVRVGQPVIFTLDGVPGKEFRGTVSRIDPTADAQTRQVRVYVRLLNKNHAIVGGQFARGRIIGDRLQNVVTVPEIAVRGTAEQPTVFVVENGVVVSRNVEVGPRDEATGNVAILSGVKAGETIIVAPASTLTPGTKVVLGSANENASANTTSATQSDSAAANASAQSAKQ